MLKRLQLLPLIVILMGVAAIATMVPGLHAFAIRDHAIGRAFLYSGAIMFFLTVMLAIVTMGQPSRMRLQGSLLALLVTFVVLPLWLAFPFVAAVPGTPYFDAWFEMISAFTTTGATLWSTPAQLPPSVHLWRALVGWSGGAFILIVAAAILAPLNLGGREVTLGRIPGHGGDGGLYGGGAAGPVRRFLQAAAAVGPAYVLLTAAVWAGLLILGEPALDGLCLSMSSLATSGITCGQDAGIGPSGLAGEGLVYMALALALSRRLMPGSAVTDRTTPLWRDPELRLAAFFLVLVPLVLLARHWVGSLEAETEAKSVTVFRALWGAMFAAMSFLTTTGFISSEWSHATLWSGLTTPGLILLGLAMMGGGVATTAGGVKLLRIYALTRHGQRELERIIHPNSIGGEGQAARRLRREGAYFAWIFFMLFAMSIAGLMLGFSLVGVPFQTSLILAVSALTTTGPLVLVAGPEPVDLAAVSALAKGLVAVGMVLGRIEVLAVVALLSWSEQRR